MPRATGTWWCLRRRLPEGASLSYRGRGSPREPSAPDSSLDRLSIERKQEGGRVVGTKAFEPNVRRPLLAVDEIYTFV